MGHLSDIWGSGAGAPWATSVIYGGVVLVLHGPPHAVMLMYLYIRTTVGWSMGYHSDIYVPLHKDHLFTETTSIWSS